MTSSCPLAVTTVSESELRQSGRRPARLGVPRSFTASAPALDSTVAHLHAVGLGHVLVLIQNSKAVVLFLPFIMYGLLCIIIGGDLVCKFQPKSCHLVLFLEILPQSSSFVLLLPGLFLFRLNLIPVFVGQVKKRNV